MSETGRFAIHRSLGTGAHAEVVAALDHHTGEHVALKRIRTPDAASRARAQAEISALRRIDDPRVVALRDVLEDAAAVTLVLDLAEGEDFIHFVRHDCAPPRVAPPHLPLAFGQLVQPMGTSAFGPCAPAGLARLRAALAEVALGITAIHQAGLVHGDLRPPNIRATSTGRVTVIDLGLATEIGATLPADHTIGVVTHLAPELGAHAIATPAIDWYALGVLLFESLTGDVPFSGTGQDVFVRKQTVPAPSPGLLVANVPDDLDELCGELLATAPGRRADGAMILRVCGSPDAPRHAPRSG